MRRLVWLSTMTMLRACHSIGNALEHGQPGDHIHQTSSEDNDRPAAKPSHVIRLTRTGRKIAERVRS